MRQVSAVTIYIYLNQLPFDADLGVITIKITTNLSISYITICPPKVLCCFLLGLIPKLNKTFYYIYNLFLFKPCLGLFINTTILKAYSTLTYSTVDKILALILFTRRGAVILKYNFKPTF